MTGSVRVWCDKSFLHFVPYSYFMKCEIRKERKAEIS